MEPIHIELLDKQEIVEGFRARFIHSSNLTLAYWDIDAEASLPTHSHMHEQITNVLEGEFELCIADKVMRLTAGDVIVIPSDVEHSGRAISACRILDVFYPLREDYR